MHIQSPHMYSRTRIGYLLLWGLAWMGVYACREDVYEFTPYPPAAEDFSALLEQVPEAANHTVFRFEGAGALSEDTMLTLVNSGVRLFLTQTETLFESEDGVPVPCSTCPSLSVEATFSARKGEWLARGLSQRSYPEGRVMESVGIVRLRASCAGKPLRLRLGRAVRVQIPVNTPKNNLSLFSAREDPKGNRLGWQDLNQPALPVVFPIASGGSLQPGYEVQLPQVGWFNCARVLPDSAVSLCVTLPKQFTALNTRVFAVFNYTHTAVELEGSLANSRFCLEKAPVGQAVSLVAISKIHTQYWAAEFFTEVGATAQLSLVPKPVSEEDILSLMKKF